MNLDWTLKRTLTRTEATKYSLLKWRELLRRRKRSKDLSEKRLKFFEDNSSADTCALCALFFQYGTERSTSCQKCPLFETGYGCVPDVYQVTGREPKYQNGRSPYINVVEGHGSHDSFSVLMISRMVKRLERALDWAEKHEDGTQLKSTVFSVVTQEVRDRDS